MHTLYNKPNRKKQLNLLDRIRLDHTHTLLTHIMIIIIISTYGVGGRDRDRERKKSSSKIQTIFDII